MRLYRCILTLYGVFAVVSVHHRIGAPGVGVLSYRHFAIFEHLRHFLRSCGSIDLSMYGGIGIGTHRIATLHLLPFLVCGGVPTHRWIGRSRYIGSVLFQKIRSFLKCTAITGISIAHTNENCKRDSGK